jgi:hypothetical protein
MKQNGDFIGKISKVLTQFRQNMEIISTELECSDNFKKITLRTDVAQTPYRNILEIGITVYIYIYTYTCVQYSASGKNLLG